MDTLPLNYTKWSDRLAFDVALMLENSGETMQEVVSRHHINTAALLRFNQDPVFLHRVGTYREEIKDKGLTFKLKARAQAEELLTTSWLLIHDASVSPAVKADLIKATVKWGGLEPKGDAVDTVGAGSVKITINLGDQNNPKDARIIEASLDDEYAEHTDVEMEVINDLRQLAS